MKAFQWYAVQVSEPLVSGQATTMLNGIILLVKNNKDYIKKVRRS